MGDPFFSIVIPTYNRKDMIGETIESAFGQTDSDFELIVVDDGSTDATSVWLQETYGDRLRLLTVDNGERGRARNIGAQHAKGRYVYFLDSDDLLYPNHLATARKYLNDSPPWFFQEYEIIEKNGDEIISRNQINYDRTQPIKSLVCKGNFMSCHGVFLRRDIAGEHPFNENREMAGSEDYALWLELAARYPLTINSNITSALVQHEERSVFNFACDKLIRRKELMLTHILTDQTFIGKFGHWISKLKGNNYGYLAFHLALSGAPATEVLFWLKKAIVKNPRCLWSRRTAATLKHLYWK